MKRYPRTLNEAFPKTLENGASIQKFYRPDTLADKVLFWVGMAGFAVVLLDIFFWRT